MKLAVLILTFNEERHIADCINSADFADEIVIIDSGSTDRTLGIAQGLGVRVVSHLMDEGFAAQRNFAMMQTEAEWVLFLDADERITPELQNSIKDVIASTEQAAYTIARRNMVMGKWLRYGGWYPDRQLRLCPKSAMEWQGLVHEIATVTLPIKKLHGDMVHYTYYDLSQNVNKQNKYSTMMSQRMYDAGKKADIADIVLRPLWAFFRAYIIKAGFKDGLLGFIMAISHYFYTLLKYAKLYYLQQEK